MPVMLLRDFVQSIRRHWALFAWSSLPVLIGLSLAIQPMQGQKVSAAQAKTAKKLDTSTLVVAPNLSAQLAKFKPCACRLTPRG